VNGWDVFTWLSSATLAASALVIFGFFLRDARSIFDREMHDHDQEPEPEPTGSPAADTSESAATGAPAPPQDLSR
jgi:hypothetical protein